MRSSSDASLALYGAGDDAGGVERMRFTFKNKGMPASNNPDDIPLLQELSRKDAELHLAYAPEARALVPLRPLLTAQRASRCGGRYAAHLYGAEGKRSEAETQWESGCIRLEACAYFSAR